MFPITITIPHLVPFLLGIILTLLIQYKLFRKDGSRHIYGLEHSVLNLELPPKLMWMNMGYWKGQDSPTDFPKACEALLTKLLDDTGLWPLLRSSPDDGVNILDLGFGCGDSTLYLAQEDLVQSYTGLTLNQQQYNTARQRLSYFVKRQQRFKLDDHFKVFLADGAKPETWNQDIRGSLAPLPRTRRANPGSRNLVLALDVLYHFSPSRQSIFAYVHDSLHATIVAFDLLLRPEPLSLTQQLTLRLIALLTSTPYTNFLTPSQYLAQLKAAGYGENEVTMEDISEHVFSPLTAFLEQRDAELKTIGSGLGMLRAAKWIFGWWSRSGVVKGYVIIARAQTEKQ